MDRVSNLPGAAIQVILHVPKMFKPSLFHPESDAWKLYHLHGPDALDFLQRVSTADVKKLPKDQGVPACLLDSQGRIQGYFSLWRASDQDFLIEFDPAGGANRVLEVIDQLTFSEKMKLEPVDATWVCRWVFVDHPDFVEKIGTLIQIGSLQIHVQSPKTYGHPWITVWGPKEVIDEELLGHFPDLKEVKLDQLEDWRVPSLGTRVGREIDSTVNPLEIGLTNAVAGQKGCYPGQEVIEKILALGAPARRLVLVEGALQGPLPQTGAPIYNLADPATEVGRVTSVVASGASFKALGIVRKIQAKEGTEVRIAAQKEGAPSDFLSGRISQVSTYDAQT